MDVRIGPGAATLTNDVNRIHLDFARKYDDGHFGARKLWRNYLPRLKYHNPAVSMTVNRHEDQSGPATLTLFFSEESVSTSSTPPVGLTTMALRPDTWQRTEVIDMRHKHESEILKQLVELTGAIPCQQSAEDTARLEKVAEDSKSRSKARERQSRINERRKYEEALLQQARESAS